MDNFTKQNLPIFREELQAFFKEFGAKHGITLKANTMRFEQYSVRFTVEARINGQKTRDERGEDHALELRMETNNLQFEGKNGEKLTGYSYNAQKYPFIYTKNGKQYKCGHEYARLLFGKGEKDTNTPSTKSNDVSDETVYIAELKAGC